MTSSAPPDDPYRDALAAALAPGYVLGRELLGGGMSRVFLAEEPALGRTVVVKVLPPDWGAGMNRERFLREIQLAARLQHPHIVPLLAAGEAAGSIYYTMPFIEGESLRAEIARGRRFSVRDVVRVLHDVVEALAYAHARGVIHRDVKPGNVLMLGHHALVTDFGVAKALSAAQQSSGGGHFAPGTTSTGLAIGTPAYMAPEQLAADPAADHRVDLYAAGLLAYELLVGASPFTESSPQATLAAQLTRMPTPLHQVRPDVPPALSALIGRCLAKEPAQRPENAESLLADLEAVSYALTPGSGTPADVLTTGTTAESPTLPTHAGTLGHDGSATTVGMTGVVTAPAPRRRLTGVLGGALLGMGIVLLGGWAVVRGFGERPAAPKAPPVPPAPVPVVTAPAPAAAAPRLTHEDSLAIAAAVERRFAAERERRERAARPLPAQAAESIRVEAWRMYADSVREMVTKLSRGTPGAPPGAAVWAAPLIQGMRNPDVRRFVGTPDSATIAALAAAGIAQGLNRFEVYRPRGAHPERPEQAEARERPEPKEKPEPPERSEARVDPRVEAAMAKLGERLAPPKPGVRRVLVLDWNDGTGRAELRGAGRVVGDAVRKALAAGGAYEVVDAGLARDLARFNLPEAALAEATHSGAVVSGTVLAYRDTTVAVLAMVHDARRGYPFTVRSPRIPGQDAQAVPVTLGDTLGTALVKALDRVRWNPPRPSVPR